MALPLPTNSNGLQTTPLLTLPTELLEMVVDQIEVSDLLAIRTLCKDLEYKTLRLFARTRTFHLAIPASMTRLQSYLKNARLASHLREIRFSSLEIADREFFIENFLTEYQKKKEDYRGAASRCASARNVWHTMDREQTHFLHYELDNALALIFAQLNQLPVKPSIVCEDCQDLLGSGKSPRTMMFHDRQMRRFIPLSSVGRQVHIPRLYKAIVDANYATTILQIGPHYQLISLNCFSYLPQHFPADNLRVLRIATLPARLRFGRININHPDHKGHVRDLLTVLMRARNVEEFPLQQDNSFDPEYAIDRDLHEDVFLAIMTKRHVDGTPVNVSSTELLLPRLKSLALRNVVIDLDTFLQLCRDRCITKLCLRSVVHRPPMGGYRSFRETQMNVWEAGLTVRDALQTSPERSIMLEDCFGSCYGQQL